MHNLHEAHLHTYAGWLAHQFAKCLPAAMAPTLCQELTWLELRHLGNACERVIAAHMSTNDLIRKVMQ